MIEARELETMDIGAACSLLAGSRMLLQVEIMRRGALEERLAQLRPEVAKEREACGLDELGRELSGRVTRRTATLDRLENTLGDTLRELQRAKDRQQALAAEIGTLEGEVGILEGFWAGCAGASDPPGRYQELVDEAVELAFQETIASRDTSEAAHLTSEEQAFKPPADASLQERLDLERGKAYRQAVARRPEQWQFYAPWLQAIAKGRGYRLARQVQARLWSEGLVPLGMGML